jgi:hypothetical protein
MLGCLTKVHSHQVKYAGATRFLFSSSAASQSLLAIVTAAGECARLHDRALIGLMVMEIEEVRT